MQSYRGERDRGGRLSTTVIESCEKESDAPLNLKRSDRSTNLCFSDCNDGDGVGDREETRRSAGPEGKTWSAADSSSISGRVVKIAGRKNSTRWLWRWRRPRFGVRADSSHPPMIEAMRLRRPLNVPVGGSRRTLLNSECITRSDRGGESGPKGRRIKGTSSIGELPSLIGLDTPEGIIDGGVVKCHRPVQIGRAHV